MILRVAQYNFIDGIECDCCGGQPFYVAPDLNAFLCEACLHKLTAEVL